MTKETHKAHLKPTDDHIIVEAVPQEEKTASGLFIPDTASKERPQKGKVIAVGPGKLTDDGKRLAMGVKAGDMILFSKYGPTEVKIDNKEILILNMSDVLAVIEE
ncbi:co-chaperone GroES [Candidatus Peregrinibacteria bacterium]|nr:co-chaperone GroES [Candidatus Peregrinibacteria bacterium]